MKKVVQLWTLFGIGSFIIAAYLFPSVMPLLNLSITMNRNEALEKAALFIQKKNFTVPDSSKVAAFIDDAHVQNFVELEGGGKDVFVQMFERNYYHPYRWKVRFFKEKAVEESEVYFTPQGSLYGYKHLVSENTLGAILSKQHAQTLAEQELKAFDVDLSQYMLVEHTQHEVMSKRLDHEFTYERTDISLRDGKYRVHVKVAGDQVVEFNHFVKVPDKFLRMYQEMRSSNSMLTLIGLILLYALYLLIFGGLIIYHLYKTRFMLWKASAITALVVAFLSNVLVNINQSSLWGLYYQTSMPYSFFVLNMLISLIMGFITYGALIFVSGVVGEGVTRITQDRHVQLWDFFKSGYLRSSAYIEHVAWAYGFVGVFCLYEVLFYKSAFEYLGWWMPASDLSDINILSAYVPWLNPIALSLQAGFFEELLFRAIPLGLMLWIVPKIKHRPILLALVLIGQGIVFGLLHTGYPGLPSYARLVELIPVACGFGLIYYFIGIIPGIIAHFVYDALLYSLPLFVSSFIIQKIIVLFFILLPLLIALYSYARGLIVLDSTHLNVAWEPLRGAQPEQEQVELADEYIQMPRMKRYIVLACGILGMLGVYQYRITHYDTHPLQVTKVQALQIAQKICEQEFNISLDDWQKCCAIRPYKDAGMDFIWRTYGIEAFQKLRDRYLYAPTWQVRFIRFDTDVAHRAEEYVAYVGPKSDDIKIARIVPEIEEGACLSQEQAAGIAYTFLEKEYGINKSEVEFISAQEKDVSHRKDWLFIFKDAAHYYAFDKGQGRLRIEIAGDKVVAHDAFIYPGEEWTRAQQAEDMKKNLFQMIITMLVGLLFFIIFIQFIGQAFNKKQLKHIIFAWGPLGLLLGLFAYVNDLPIFLSRFNTIQPWMHQIFQMSMSFGMGLITALVSIIFMLGILNSYYKPRLRYNFLPAIEYGIFLFIMLRILGALFSDYVPYTSPFVIQASSYFAGYGIFFEYLQSCLYTSILFIGSMKIAHMLGWPLLQNIVQVLLYLLLSFHMIFGQNCYFLSDIPLIGILWTLVLCAGYYLVFRYDMLYVFISFVTLYSIRCAERIFISDFPDSSMHYAIALVLFVGAVIQVFRLMQKFSDRK